MSATQHRQATDTVAPPAGSPVFVDATGRRARRIRRIAVGLAIGVCGYGVVVVISLLGGPVPPNVLLPLPGVANGPAAAQTATSATPHATAATRAGGGNPATGLGPGSGTAPAASRTGAPGASPTAATAPGTSAAASPTAAASRVPPGLAGKSATPGATGHRH